ncbi:MAG: hypothetical protein KTR25_12295 [Myxococcales bacterium]|nr:hypothetical protein [Myxococcales bacterium]
MNLVTKQGVLLSADTAVLTLFAALNAVGYSEELQRSPPPLRKPLFDPIRQVLRRDLSNLNKAPTIIRLRTVFETHSESIASYVESVLMLRHRKSQSVLSAKLKVLEEFNEEVALNLLLAPLWPEFRKKMSLLKGALEHDFEELAGLLGIEELRASPSLIVVLNPLDGHGLVHIATVKQMTYIILGPDIKVARQEVLRAIIRPTIQTMVNKAYTKAVSLRHNWNKLYTENKSVHGWRSGGEYLAETLSNALIHRTMNASGKKHLDEVFIEAQEDMGMWWARIALRAVDTPRRRSFAQVLPQILSTLTL